MVVFETKDMVLTEKLNVKYKGVSLKDTSLLQKV